MTQMTTKVTIKAGEPVSIASSFAGANLDCIAFNLALITQEHPEIAHEVIALYDRARELKYGKPAVNIRDLTRQWRQLGVEYERDTAKPKANERIKPGAPSTRKRGDRE